MPRLHFSLLLLAACAGPQGATLPQGARGEGLYGRTAARSLPGPRQELDATHYELQLELHPADRALEGTCRIHAVVLAEGLRFVTLDLADLEVREVRDQDGHTLRHAHQASSLRVDLGREHAAGERLELEVDYGGTPNRGLWYAPGVAPTHCFTQGECEDARRWFPCIDHPSDRATSALEVDMPRGWTSIAGGERLDRQEVGDRAVERWIHRTPHPAYLETLVAGSLAVVEDPRDPRVEYAGPTPLAAALLPNLGQTPDVLAFLGKLSGHPYPYPRYATAAVDGFPFGGMENMGATTITTSALCDERGLADGGPEGLVVHEAAHQWFGDLLTCEDWDHIWLNEGFATYCTLLWFEVSRGPDDFLVRTMDLMASAAAAERRAIRPVVHDVCIEPMDLFFTGHAYQGGAARLHHLRFVLGDEAFIRGLREYVGRFQHSSVRTEDLRSSLEAVSSLDLRLHFEQWVYSPGVPHFVLDWEHDAKSRQLRVRVRQTQDAVNGTPQVFETPIELEWRSESQLHRERVAIKGREARFELPCDTPPLWVRLDPRHNVPCEKEEEHSLTANLRLAAEAPDPAGRIEALKRLQDAWPSLDQGERRLAFDVIGRRLAADPLSRVRAAACSALGAARTASARDLLRRAADADAEPSVRAAALDGLGAFAPDTDLFDVARQAFLGSISWDHAGAALRLAARADAASAALWFRELQVAPGLLQRDDHAGRLAQHLAAACVFLEGDAALGLLESWISSEAPALARARALSTLRPWISRSGSLRLAVEQLVGDHDPRLSRAAVDALVAVGDERAREVLAPYYDRTASTRERRAIEALFPGP